MKYSCDLFGHFWSTCAINHIVHSVSLLCSLLKSLCICYCGKLKESVTYLYCLSVLDDVDDKMHHYTLVYKIKKYDNFTGVSVLSKNKKTTKKNPQGYTRYRKFTVSTRFSSLQFSNCRMHISSSRIQTLTSAASNCPLASLIHLAWIV